MRAFIILLFVLGTSTLFSQIQVREQSNSDVSLIGKISYSLASQTKGLSRKLPVLNPLELSKDDSINKYRNIRKEANDMYASTPVRKSTITDDDFAASLLYFKKLDKYLITIKNIEYNFQNESFWLSPDSKNELFDLINKELDNKPKYKNIEVIIDNNFVLVISINRNKVSFNIWDGTYWINSYWFKKNKFIRLFGK